jgi:hypothetical protein
LNQNRRRGATAIVLGPFLLFQALVAPVTGLADDAAPALLGCKPGDYVCAGAKGTLATPPQNADVGGHGTVASPAATHAVVGYVWLGNLEKDNSIAAATMRLQSGAPLLSISQLAPEVMLVDVNPVYIRETKPQNNGDYYRSIPVTGVLQEGKTAKLLSAPIQYERPSGLVQLWGQVQAGN